MIECRLTGEWQCRSSFSPHHPCWLGISSSCSVSRGLRCIFPLSACPAQKWWGRLSLSDIDIYVLSKGWPATPKPLGDCRGSLAITRSLYGYMSALSPSGVAVSRHGMSNIIFKKEKQCPSMQEIKATHHGRISSSGYIHLHLSSHKCVWWHSPVFLLSRLLSFLPLPNKEKISPRTTTVRQGTPNFIIILVPA